MIHARTRACLLLLSDLTTLSVVWILVAWIYFLLGGDYEMVNYYRCWPILFVYAVIAASFNLYHGNLIHTGIALDPVQELRYIVRSVFITYLFFLAYLTASRQSENYSRMVCVFSAFSSTILLIPMRNLMRKFMDVFGIGKIPFLLCGRNSSGEHLLAVLREDTHYGLKCVGYLDLRGDIDGTQRKDVNLVICCIPKSELDRHYHDLTSRFRFIVFLEDGQCAPVFRDDAVCIGHELFGTQICNRLLLPFPRFLKTVLEYAVSLLLAIIVLPLMAVIALAVRLSGKGPVFYHAHRLGQYGKPIRILKFRTMYVDADKKLEQILSGNQTLQREWEENMKLTDDPRVTPLGRFLRKTSLDELPQFFDVLAGRLALIGPRPIVEDEVARYGENYRYLKQIKPGITGLWQISGRSDTGYAQRVMLDMWYLGHWSVWLDIYICFATISAVIHCRGAK